MKTWAHRVHRAPTQELRQFREAALDIAQQGAHAPGKFGVVFQKVAEGIFIGSALIGGVVTGVHLWKSLFPRQREQRHEQAPQAAGQGGDPPRLRHTHAAAYEDDRAGRQAAHGRGRD
jgi:hypothetical protein